MKSKSRYVSRPALTVFSSLKPISTALFLTYTVKNSFQLVILASQFSRFHLHPYFSLLFYSHFYYYSKHATTVTRLPLLPPINGNIRTCNPQLLKETALSPDTSDLDHESSDTSHSASQYRDCPAQMHQKPQLLRTSSVSQAMCHSICWTASCQRAKATGRTYRKPSRKPESDKFNLERIATSPRRFQQPAASSGQTV